MFRFSPAARLSPPALIGMAAIAAGAGMIGKALPVAAGSLLEIPGNPILRQMQYERAPKPPVLRRFIHSREAAANWRGASRAYRDIALGRLMLAETGADAQRCANLALAETALARTLSLAPMNPYGWMRLVQVRTMRSAAAADIAEPLKLALLSGPREDRRDAMRLLVMQAGLSVWNDLDHRQRRLIEGKAREAWRRDAAATAAAAVRAGETELLARLLGF